MTTTETTEATTFPRSVEVDGLTITRSQFMRAVENEFIRDRDEISSALFTLAADRRAGAGYHAVYDGNGRYRAGQHVQGGTALFGGSFDVDGPSDEAVDVAEGWLEGKGKPAPRKPKAAPAEVTLPAGGLALTPANKCQIGAYLKHVCRGRRTGRLDTLDEVLTAIRDRGVEKLLEPYTRTAWIGAQVSFSAWPAEEPDRDTRFQRKSNDVHLVIERIRGGWKLLSARATERWPSTTNDDVEVARATTTMLEVDAKRTAAVLAQAQQHADRAAAALAKRRTEEATA